MTIEDKAGPARLPGTSGPNPQSWRREFGGTCGSWLMIECSGTSPAATLAQARREAGLAWSLLTAGDATAGPIPQEALSVGRGSTQIVGPEGRDILRVRADMVLAAGLETIRTARKRPWPPGAGRAAMRGACRRAAFHLMASGHDKIEVVGADTQSSGGAFAHLRCGVIASGSVNKMPTPEPMRAAIICATLAEAMSRKGDEVARETVELPASATLRAILAERLSRTAREDTIAATEILRAVGRDQAAEAFERLYGA